MNKHKSASDAELRHHTEMMVRLLFCIYCAWVHCSICFPSRYHRFYNWQNTSSNVYPFFLHFFCFSFVQLREREHLSELQRIEEEISRQRLSTLNSLEAAAKDEMDLMDKVRFIICCFSC